MLDNDGTARAILQYSNTPIQNIGLYSAQLLLYSKKSSDNSIWSERLSHRAIQQNNTHLMSPVKGANCDNTTTNNPLMKHSPTTNTVSELMDQVESRSDTADSSENSKHQQPHPPIPSTAHETSTPNPNPMPLKPNTPVLQTMDTGKISNIAQPSTMTQTTAPRALSRLHPHNQPCLKVLIPTQRPLPSYDGGRSCRIIITHTSVVRPASRQK